MDDKSKLLIIVGAVVILLVAAGGYWYWSKSRQGSSLQEAPTLGSEIFDKTQNQFQGQVPDANPFETASNPFKKETNPMRAIYTNPFGEQ